MFNGQRPRPHLIVRLELNDDVPGNLGNDLARAMARMIALEEIDEIENIFDIHPEPVIRNRARVVLAVQDFNPVMANQLVQRLNQTSGVGPSPAAY